MADRDAELVAKAQRGDRAAYGELVQAHMRWVGAVAAGVLGDLSAARDVACESFRRAFVSLGKLPSRRRFQPWLYTITQRTALDWLRHHQEAQDTSPMRAVGTGAPDEGLRVVAATLALPPHYREAVLLRHVGGCSCADTAKLVGGEPGDAELRLARGEHTLTHRVAAAHGGRAVAAAGLVLSDELATEMLRYLDKTAAAGERAAFEGRLAASAELRREVEMVQATRARVAEALRAHPFGHELAEAAIRQLPEFAQEATDPDITTRVARYQRRALAIALAAAVVAAGVAMVVIERSRRRELAVAQRERAEGPVQLERRLAARSWVRTPVGSNVALRLCDESRVIVRGNSSVLLQARRRLYLSRGEMWVEVAATDEPFVVAAPVGWVSCDGAELVVQSTDELTRVALRRGRATLRGRGKLVDVGEGQVAMIAEGKEPAVSQVSEPAAFFGWVDEFLAGPPKKTAVVKPKASPPPPPAPAGALPRQKVLEHAAFAEGRSPCVLGLHALLRAAGAKASYSTVAGLSGDPFRFFYTTAGGAYGANLYVENPLRVACGLLGYRLEFAAGRPWAATWRAVRATIAGGSPILVGALRDPRIVYPTMNWLLVYGYDLDRRVVRFHALDWPGDVRRSQLCTVEALRDAHGGYRGAALEPDFPTPPADGFPSAPQYRIVGRVEAEPPQRRVAVLTALARAVAYAKGTARGKALDEHGRPAGEAAMGLAAFALWQRHVGSGARGGPLTAAQKQAIAHFGDAAGIPRFGWPLVVLKLARKDAAEFLMEVLGDFEAPTQRELLAAASVYRDIVEDIASLGTVYPSAGAEGAGFAAGCSRASILIEALRHKEAAALGHLAHALKLEAAAGRKPLAVPSFGEGGN